MTAEVLKNTLSGPGKICRDSLPSKKAYCTGLRFISFFLLQQILALTEAEWQEMARGHNILLKQTQASVLMSEQKVNLERAGKIQPLIPVQER